MPTETLPIHAILVFDTSSSVKGAKLERLRAAAQSFLDRLRPRDEAGLVSFSDEIAWLAPLSRDIDRVRSALLSLRARGSTSVRDALFSALVMPKSALRTLVILFSDGKDTMSWLSERQIRGAVERSNALIHVVAARSEDFRPGFPGKSLPEDPADIRTLRGLAETTGGSVIVVDSPDRIDAAFFQIIEEMKNRYVLRYDLEEEGRPGWHRLEVQLKSKKGNVRGRTGYWMEKR